MKNKIKVIFDSDSSNEAFARVVIASFIARLDPTLEEITDVKTAVSEAVTNCIVHAYEGTEGNVTMEAWIEDKEVSICITDEGVGIKNLEQAMEPMYTSKPELERSGMGFSFMEAFMDELKVTSKVNEGTKVFMKKVIK